jgi:hypothetical protein
MTLRKTLREVVVDSLVRIRDGARARFGDDGGDEVSIRLDTSTNPSALVVEDENNTTEQVRLPIGKDLAATLAAGGANDYDPRADIQNGEPQEMSVQGLSGDLADAQDPKDHAGDHSQGGGDEITVENLGTGSNDTGAVVKPDGNGGLQIGGGGVDSGTYATIYGGY